MMELRQLGIDAQTIAATLRARRDAAATWDGSTPPTSDLTANPDEAAARKLLARQARILDRIADPRARRQRAYALLARNGFDPETCRSASTEMIVEVLDPDPLGEEPVADAD
jgi:SOS response regulatory protein OraA/RecX